MRGIPTEVLYLLVFVAIGLIRYLWERLRRVHPWEEALARQQRSAGRTVPEAPEPQTAPAAGVAGAPGHAPDAMRAPARAPGTARLHEARLHEARPRRGASPPAPGMRRAPKRFSRQALFGDRRRTQDAVVAAAILGPCRASAPYDRDP